MTRPNLLFLIVAALTFLGVTPVASAHYNPVQGRWMERDPLGFKDGTNLYLAVGGDPITFVDPHGMERWKLSCFRCTERLTPTDRRSWYYKCMLWDQDDPSNFEPNLEFNKPPRTTNPPLNVPAAPGQDPYGKNLPIPPGPHKIVPGSSPTFDPKWGKGRTPSVTEPGRPPGSLRRPKGVVREGLRFHQPGKSDGCITLPLGARHPFEVLWRRLNANGPSGVSIDLEIIEDVDCSKESPVWF